MQKRKEKKKNLKDNTSDHDNIKHKVHINQTVVSPSCLFNNHRMFSEVSSDGGNAPPFEG